MAKNPIDTKQLLQITLISFVIIEGLSYLGEQLGLFSFIRGGFFLILILVVIFFSTLFNLGTNITALKTRDIILMIIVLLLVVALYFILPLAVPSVFSIFSSQETRDSLVRTLSSVAGIGTGAV